MALILCPECQQKVSDKASQCPHCGFRLSPAAQNAPAQAASAGEPARPQTLPVPSDDDRSGSVTAAAPEQKTKNTESSPKTPMENKKKLMIGAAVAAVLLIGYFVFFSGGNAQTPAPSLPSPSRPATRRRERRAARTAIRPLAPRRHWTPTTAFSLATVLDLPVMSPSTTM